MLTARALLSLALFAACRGGGAAPAPSALEPDRPLSSFGARRVIVLPVQSIDDGAGWSGALGGLPAMRTRLDDELSFSLRERGLGERWILPEALAASTRRAGTYVPDPRALAVEPLRRRREAPRDPLADPLASQLRALVAFTDARWVLLPIEARVERHAAGTAQLALQLAVIDARGALVTWLGEVRSDTVRTAGPAPFAAVAARVADLIVPSS
jgi:hypothetical protein